jgi:hypothetical protein
LNESGAVDQSADHQHAPAFIEVNHVICRFSSLFSATIRHGALFAQVIRPNSPENILTIFGRFLPPVGTKRSFQDLESVSIRIAKVKSS